ncbi:right-handed parallel beta-helix repeat-containing protein [Candidatus Woesearchaeota archaeon]|nr:right-handed parallel beta-helix repeat-containing protein [Candidatus Woesearchaeota archaeon]
MRQVIWLALAVLLVTPVFACITPSADNTMVSSSDTVCYRSTPYYISDVDGNGIFNFTSDDIVLDCNGSEFSGSAWSGFGIYLHSRTNITVKDCTFRYFDSAIFLDSSSDNEFHGIRAYDNNDGFVLFNSTYNILNSSDLVNNSGSGISLSGGSDRNVFLDVVSGSNSKGLSCEDSDMNSVIGCSFEGQDFGLFLSNCTGSVFTGNDYMSNAYGAYLDHCRTNDFEDESVNGSTYGLYLDNGSGTNDFSRMAMTSNTYGVILENSSSNDFQGIDVSHGYMGFVVGTSSGNEFSDCTVMNMSQGIYLLGSGSNMFDNVIVHGSSDLGFYSVDSHGNIVRNSFISGNGMGVLLESSHRNQIIGTWVFDSADEGIMLDDALNTTIDDSFIYNNSDGISVSSSGRVRILDTDSYDNRAHGIRCLLSGIGTYSRLGLYSNNNGLLMSGCDDADITDVISYDNVLGFNITDSHRAYISGSEAYGNRHGFVFSASLNSTVDGSGSYSNNESGFLLGSGSEGNSFTGSYSYDNRYGFYFSAGSNNVSSANISGNTVFGFYFSSGSGNMVRDSVICHNSRLKNGPFYSQNAVVNNTFCVDAWDARHQIIKPRQYIYNFTSNTSNHINPANCTWFLNDTVNGIVYRNSTLVDEGSPFAFSLRLKQGIHPWNVSCYDSDGNDGVSAQNFLEILNTPPTQTAPSLSSSSGHAYNKDSLACKENNINDIDGDNMTVYYYWWKDGVRQDVSNASDVLSADLTSKGDTWNCSVKVYDNRSFGVERFSSSLVIIDDIASGGGSPLVMKGGSPLVMKYVETVPSRSSRRWDSIEAGIQGVFNVDNAELAVTRLTFIPLKALRGITITMEKVEGLPASVPVLEDVFEYLRISSSNLMNSDMDDIRIEFRVKKLWFSLNDFDEKRVYLNRYFNDGWVRLPTSYVTQDSDYHFYMAETDGFSYFAITSGDKGIPESVKEQPTVITGTREQPESGVVPEKDEGPAKEEPASVKSRSLLWVILSVVLLGALVGGLAYYVLASKQPEESSFLLPEERFDEFQPKDLHPSQHLVLNDGRSIKNIKDFYMALVTMSDFTFEQHLNQQFLDESDFYRWAKEDLGDEALAMELEDVTGRAEMIGILKRHISMKAGKESMPIDQDRARLKSYILDLRQLGHSGEVIRQKLYDIGWKREFVDDVVKEVIK